VTWLWASSLTSPAGNIKSTYKQLLDEKRWKETPYIAAAIIQQLQLYLYIRRFVLIVYIYLERAHLSAQIISPNRERERGTSRSSSPMILIALMASRRPFSMAYKYPICIDFGRLVLLCTHDIHGISMQAIYIYMHAYNIYNKIACSTYIGLTVSEPYLYYICLTMNWEKM
jgi:hypothetical protein